NGDAPPITKAVEGVENTIAPATAEEKAQRSTQATAVNSTTIDNLSDAVICSFFVSQPNSPQLDNADLQQIHPDDLEDMDLRWQMARLTMGAMRFLKNTRRKFSMNCTETIRFDKSKMECYNYHKKGHSTRECMALRNQENKNREKSRRSVLMETPASSAKLLDCQIVDKCKTGLGYNVVPPPYTGNFMPPKPDLSFSGLEEFVNEPIVSEPTVKKPIVEPSEAKASADKPKVERKNFSSTLIEDWISNSEDEATLKSKIEKKTVKPSFC
nr:hypothetical protein [Tanacetum cinerariifolium]